MNLKAKTVDYEELKECRINFSVVDPIEEKAKQRIFRDLYKDPKTRLKYGAIINDEGN